jgi:hypothetical protein
MGLLLVGKFGSIIAAGMAVGKRNYNAGMAN